MEPRSKAQLHDFILIVGIIGLLLNAYVIYDAMGASNSSNPNSHDGQAGFIYMGIFFGRFVNALLFSILLLVLLATRQRLIPASAPFWLTMIVVCVNLVALEVAWLVLMG